tara:strand:+ start:3921 stop:4736 length:816 start_codon:yes stop_codon:yes gene_type:complete
MSETSKKVNTTLFNNPVEAFPGLTINDLNRYLPALQTTQDIKMDLQHMKEGMFLANCLDGLRKLPNNSIDLIIANPLNKDDGENLEYGNNSTLQSYYQWNQSWVEESRRVLKNSGALYLFSSWEYSGMFQGLLSNVFHIQSRITWRDKINSNKRKLWRDETSDIWFVTKSEEFLFKQNTVGVNAVNQFNKHDLESNLWLDIPGIPEQSGKYPQKLFLRIIEASSFKLNWILDPFMSIGDVGVACKTKGRRFIGFETNKDNLLLSMKRVDNS